MSASEGTSLKELLRQIANEKVFDIAKGFDVRVHKTTEAQEAWSNLSKAKNAYQNANKCYEQFKKISRNIA